MEYNQAAKIIQLFWKECYFWKMLGALTIQRRFRKRWFNYYLWNTYYKNNIQIPNENGLLTCFIRLPLKDNFYRYKKCVGYFKAIENLEFVLKLFNEDSD